MTALTLIIIFQLAFIGVVLSVIISRLDRAAKNHDEQNEILMEIYKKLKK